MSICVSNDLNFERIEIGLYVMMALQWGFYNKNCCFITLKSSYSSSDISLLTSDFGAFPNSMLCSYLDSRDIMKHKCSFPVVYDPPLQMTIPLRSDTTIRFLSGSECQGKLRGIRRPIPKADNPVRRIS